MTDAQRIARDIEQQLSILGAPTLEEEAQVAAIRQGLEAMLSVWEWVMTDETCAQWLRSRMDFASMGYAVNHARRALAGTSAGAELLKERDEFRQLNIKLRELYERKRAMEIEETRTASI